MNKTLCISTVGIATVIAVEFVKETIKSILTF